MGRAKIPTKYIQNERSRKMAFRQRKKGLITKISEFCIRSEANACLIVYDGDDNNVGPTIWPEDPTIVNSMLQEYEHQKIEKTPKIFDVDDYFENKKDMAEAQITKVRKAIIKNNYSTWHPQFNNMEEHLLRNFIATLDAKIQECDHKINILKNMQQSETSFLQNNAHMQNIVQESVVSSHSNQVNGIHSIPQLHDISEMVNFNHGDLPQSTKQLHGISEMVNFSHGDLPPNTSTNRLSELVEWGQGINPDYISESVEFTCHGDLPSSSSTNRLSELMEWGQGINPDYISESVEFTSHGDLPPSSSTNRLSEHVEWGQVVSRPGYISESVEFISHGDLPPSSSTNRLRELFEWGQVVNPNYISESVEFTSHGDLAPSSSTNQLSQLVDHDDWIKDLDPRVLPWASQPDQFAWKDLSCSSQNEESSASLDGSTRVNF